MDKTPLTTQAYLAFTGNRLLVYGNLETVLLQVKEALKNSEDAAPLIFEEDSGKQVDFDFRGSAKEILARALPAQKPGRPRLGVTSREVTLLPRHWEWLEGQPNGASATLRHLIDEARLREPNKVAARKVRDAAGKIMWSLGGNLKDFEEASRALYATDLKRFKALVASWPKDIRDYLIKRLNLASQLSAGQDA